MGRPEEALEQGRRALLVTRDPRGAAPRVQPLAYWYDGAGLWMTAPAGAAAAVRELRQAADCALAVIPAGGHGAAFARGRGRVYALDDPVGLAVHAPMISAALAALALRHPRGLAQAAPAALRDLTRAPARGVPAPPVVIRVVVDRLDEPADVAVPAGIAPALPMAVPPEVRRALAGMRSVVVATSGDGGPRLLPAVWGAGFSLALPEGVAPPAAAPATVVASRDGGDDAVVLALAGVLAAPAALRVEEATWWGRGAHGSAAVSAAPTGAVVLPD